MCVCVCVCVNYEREKRVRGERKREGEEGRGGKGGKGGRERRVGREGGKGGRETKEGDEGREGVRKTEGWREEGERPLLQSPCTPTPGSMHWLAVQMGPHLWMSQTQCLHKSSASSVPTPSAAYGEISRSVITGAPPLLLGQNSPCLQMVPKDMELLS